MTTNVIFVQGCTINKIYAFYSLSMFPMGSEIDSQLRSTEYLYLHA